jgi:NTP pyrophosphatase (non-canonical NTP hydrolase)|tara:strand:+ start:466 stop:777 length:312 start_codon:yes stop_codon:yes gene_type:complete
VDFREYQRKAVTFAIYPATHKVLYPTLGLCGESGEVAEKVKKQVRDGVFNRHEVAKELGDVLWYLANICNDIGYNLDEIADLNLTKLRGRMARNVIKGSGDNR